MYRRQGEQAQTTCGIDHHNGLPRDEKWDNAKDHQDNGSKKQSTAQYCEVLFNLGSKHDETTTNSETDKNCILDLQQYRTVSGLSRRQRKASMHTFSAFSDFPALSPIINLTFP
jgi:hypothetical protein